MIEIIKRGTKHIVVCDACGCKFSFEDEDVDRVDTDPIGRLGFKEVVICPQCVNEVVIRQTR